MDIRQQDWESSYARGENHLFFPKEAIIRFLSRHVRRRVSPTGYKDLLDFSSGVDALDLGCGIGRQTILLAEFGLRAWGVDVSATAVGRARELAEALGQAANTEFQTVDGLSLPFETDQFRVSVSDSVLDSMRFETARRLVAELDRVTNGLLFVTLISGDDSRHYPEYAEEEVVEADFERGTVQSYFNWSKVQHLFDGTGFEICDAELSRRQSLTQSASHSRYEITLRNDLARPGGLDHTRAGGAPAGQPD